VPVSAYQSLERAVIVHEFEIEVAASVLAHGSKSYAEVVSSRNAPMVRLAMELSALGLQLDLSNPLHRTLVPKYGYVVLPNRPENAGFGKSTRSWGHFYGEVSAVLKHSVKDRALWQYGNSGRLRPFSESLKDPSSISEPHLEGLIFGPLDAGDIEYLVIAPRTLAQIAEEREIVRTKKATDFPNQEYVPSLAKRLAQFDKFLETSRVLGVPVYEGEIQTRLKPTGEGGAFQLKSPINGVNPSTPRPQLSPAEVEARVGGIPKSDYEVDMDKVFLKGRSLEEQLKRYAEVLSALLNGDKACSVLGKLAGP